MTPLATFKEAFQGTLHAAYPDLKSSHALNYKNSFGAVAGYVDGRSSLPPGSWLRPETVKGRRGVTDK